ncbi:MAG TPA: regulatory signaling modulator protein AmpE [Pseudomonadales bacterium]
MKFLSLIAVMLLVQYWSVSPSIQRDGLFHAWRGMCQKALSVLPSGAIWAFVVLLPALLAGLAIEMMAGWLWGAVSLALSIALLLYGLGRGDLSEQVEEYLSSWQQADWQAAWHHAQSFVSQEALDETADPVQLHQYACRAIAYQGFERLFAVVFWFMVLGPAGAVFYRFTSLQARESKGGDDPLDQQMLYLLEWLPARILAFTCALAGNFNTAMNAIELGWLDMTRSMADFLSTACAGALQWAPMVPPDMNDDAAVEAFVSQGQQDVRALMTLLARCGMIWLALIALWQVLRIW